ncbi:excalibur calcium-binding domain-containing protein [Defluviimonas sp. WL0050]|uniref:Excalibur calcium-binding domain-containing protein n=1 Tax=Albidovulum litorale TaxID=2984134 RepID=A0ABT2ZSJ9_9RHOB|nr:excalibur calcium-binding domain-containing protein [Defluviimonas sp. WL0050]MCV2873736.1 excalibur calcium-binding domain-containing protein [Defluviimonas sp. WL0050]
MTARPHLQERTSGRRDRNRPGLGRILSSTLAKLMAIPVIAVATAVSIYIRTSPYPPAEALAHLIARAGCPAAAAIGLAGARMGELGYHDRNDPDGDGIACAPATAADGQVTVTKAGGAKFVRPKPAGDG